MSMTSYVLEQEELEKDFPQMIEQDLLDRDPEYQAMSESIDISENDPVLEGF